MSALQFELRAYAGDDDGVIADREEVTFERFASDAAAKSFAGRMARRIKGPVDLARAGGADWDERYLTTAAPSDFHASGFRFERLT